MKATIYFKDGHTEVIEDAAPNFDCEIDELCLAGKDNEVLDTVTISLVKKVVWENDSESK